MYRYTLYFLLMQIPNFIIGGFPFSMVPLRGCFWVLAAKYISTVQTAIVAIEEMRNIELIFICAIFIITA